MIRTPTHSRRSRRFGGYSTNWTASSRSYTAVSNVSKTMEQNAQAKPPPVVPVERRGAIRRKEDRDAILKLIEQADAIAATVGGLIDTMPPDQVPEWLRRKHADISQQLTALHQRLAPGVMFLLALALAS